MTREHWQNFNNNVNAGIDPSYSSLSDKNYYDSFYIYMSHEIDSFLKQEKKWSREVLKDEIHLEQREKTRWVFNTLIVKAFITIKEISLRQDIFPKEKISLYLYSIFIGFFIFLIYVFSYLYLNLLNKMNNRSDYSDRLGLSIFLFFSYFLTISYLNFVHYRGGEDNFSIFETLCIISALYLITLNKKWSILIYIVVCCLAPLVRESGIFISLYYLCYRFIFFKEIKILGFLVPILSTLPYILSNYDLFYFYFQEGFIYSTKNIESQTTFFDLRSNLVGTLNAIFYNFIIFFIPLFIFFKKENKLQLYTLMVIIFYFLLLAFGSVLDHVSTRFMPSIFIISFIYIGINNLKINND